MATESPGATSGVVIHDVVDTPLELNKSTVAEVAPTQQQQQVTKEVEETPTTIPEEMTQNSEEKPEEKEAEKEEEAETTVKSGDVAEPIPEEPVKEEVINKVEENVVNGMLLSF